MAYERYYSSGWQSGESGGTPITPEALTHMENGIENAVPVDGTKAMRADLPMAGHNVTGLGTPAANGDAVPLGYAEQNFAPAGYGLGVGVPTTVKSLEELDNLTLSGNYRLALPSWTPVNNVSLANASIRVDTLIDNGSTKECFQMMKINGTSVILIRHLAGGVWSPFECVAGTEPMLLGMEYRTTERWNGKAVYTKLLDLGATTSEQSLNIPIPGIVNLIRIVPNLGGVVCSEWNSESTNASVTNTFYFMADKGNDSVAVYVVCGTNRVGKTLTVQAWYTKD